MNTVRKAHQIEIDTSDYERGAFAVSTLDERGVWIDTFAVYDTEAKARRAAKKIARRTGLPIVTRNVHPAFA